MEACNKPWLTRIAMYLQICRSTGSIVVNPRMGNMPSSQVFSFPALRLHTMARR